MCIGGGSSMDSTGQLFGKPSLTLMRGKVRMISSKCQDADFPTAEIDGFE